MAESEMRSAEAAWLVAARKALGLKQAGLALALDVSGGFIGDIERGAKPLSPKVREGVTELARKRGIELPAPPPDDQSPPLGERDRLLTMLEEALAVAKIQAEANKSQASANEKTAGAAERAAAAAERLAEALVSRAPGAVPAPEAPSPHSAGRTAQGRVAREEAAAHELLAGASGASG